LQDPFEVVGVVEPHAPQYAEPPAATDRGGTFSDGVKTKIGYSMPKRSHSSVLKW